MSRTMKSPATLATAIAALALLTGCGAGDRLANIGRAPEMSQISNPQMQRDYKPVSMPMPAQRLATRSPNSLWDINRKGFFKDQRAADVGDVLTVNIEIDDKAELDNESERTRSSDESAALPKLLGMEGSLARYLPQSVDPTNLTSATADSSHDGKGSIDRKEKIEVKLAALVTQILPNGNFVISGKQEIRVNFEKRILQVMGIVRPQDISINNSVDYDQIAEARIVYGGEGQITDMQQPRYGQQLYDVVFPF